ncbi:molecular chaperone HscC [Acinetobacter marinus]|uniref:Molecular chaperone HscC n=1 Tax=Acinetobacter marinus TaxID=281375 RepID=A0A1G6GY46_9GAMM|nr:molecular chaperone HscC [Acinetobacter marinus]SDB86871.1 molecular chaperone HscC [Acinetobacter marinus]
MDTQQQLIAIDLGTTNSLVGIYQDGESTLIDNAYGQKSTPSAIALDESGQILIGQAALELRHKGLPVLTSFKRLMGTDKKMQLGQQRFNATELSSLILTTLKQDAEHALGHSVNEAIITVPAYFNDIQRQATISAAELAGLKVARLINEPTAAALAYGLGQSEDSCFLVFDLGGGTFDVSIVELFDGVIEVRASAGDNYLGGDDFVSMIMKQFWLAHGVQFGAEEGVETIPIDIETALRAKAQRALHQLSKDSQVSLDFSWQGVDAYMQIEQQQFNQWVEPLLTRLRRPLERAMRDARIRPNDIDQIVLVGGATRIPVIRKMITKLFGRFPSTSIQPDEAIVRGACVQAGLKAKDQSLKEVVLTDVCPFSLGIAITEEHVFDPIIERNTVIPASKVNNYQAIHKGQRSIGVKIYQGEHRLCKENIFLGELDVPLPPNNELLTIDVRFSYNPNGILDVDVHVPSTGENLQKVLINHQSVMSAEQVEQARLELAKLKIHPRDNLVNKALLLRAERLFSEHTGYLRQEIGEKTQQFSQILDGQDERKIRETRPYFEKFLNDIEQQGMFDDY